MSVPQSATRVESVANELNCEPSNYGDAQIEAWICQAKAGSADALGELVSAFRNYLLAIANRRLPLSLRAKIGASDLVQKTALDAHRNFASFRGCHPDEFLAWLRKILLNNATKVDRGFRACSKRQVAQEISLIDVVDVAGNRHHSCLSPSTIVSSLEEQARVEEAIARLPNNKQVVILLRNREHLPFAEIGARLGISADAARKLWARAIERLQEELVQDDDRRTP